MKSEAYGNNVLIKLSVLSEVKRFLCVEHVLFLTA